MWINHFLIHEGYEWIRKSKGKQHASSNIILFIDENIQIFHSLFMSMSSIQILTHCSKCNAWIFSDYDLSWCHFSNILHEPPLLFVDDAVFSTSSLLFPCRQWEDCPPIPFPPPIWPWPSNDELPPLKMVELGKPVPPPMFCWWDEVYAVFIADSCGLLEFKSLLPGIPPPSFIAWSVFNFPCDKLIKFCTDWDNIIFISRIITLSSKQAATIVPSWDQLMSNTAF